jgi:acid phosphatase family membrane protein YuiD
MNVFKQLLSNQALIAALLAWTAAQLLKLPLDYIINHHWNWRVLFSPGGMPSSHSAISTAATLAIGLFHGFDTPLFALSVTLTMIVIYDATSVRREAGIHAKWLNLILDEVFASSKIPKKKLREMLGHTPFEAIAGITLGIITAFLVWLFCR